MRNCFASRERKAHANPEAYPLNIGREMPLKNVLFVKRESGKEINISISPEKHFRVTSKQSKRQNGI